MPTDLDVYHLKSEIEAKLRRGYVTSRVLLGRSRFLDESSRKSSAFNDPHHLPFYYFLGSLSQPKKVVEVGVGLGLRAACVGQGAPVESFLGLQETGDEYYSERLARSNIRDYVKPPRPINIYNGLITDREFIHNLGTSKWDLALVSGETNYNSHMGCLDSLWSALRLGGLIAMDYQTRHEPSSKAFAEFCKIKNRDPLVVKTRYGVGLIQK